MNLSELAQKNRRLKFWKEILLNRTLSDKKQTELLAYLKSYQNCLSAVVKHSDPLTGAIPEADIINLVNLERNIEQLDEEARLESAKSSLLIE